ncbi:MAG: hypothetical protein WED07_05305 [Candidatus Freyarchaeum deiterrae]
MNKKRLIGVLLTVMIALTFSVFILTPLGSSGTYSATNPYAYIPSASQVNAKDIGAKQGPFSLTISFKTYYIQESGDVMLFAVLASNTTSGTITPGVVLGNGTTGWHFVPMDYYTPSITLSNIEGNVSLFIYGGLLKNVWPSGYRIVDECFGLVGLYNHLDNSSNRPNLFTANGNYHMLLFMDVTAS